MTGSESRGGVVDAILQRYEDLSDAENAVADFILTHKGTVSSLSAVENARLSGISNTTVSRFVRSLDYVLETKVEELRQSRRSPSVRTSSSRWSRATTCS